MEEELYAAIGETIRARRERKGMTQAALAALVGMSRPSVANIERGRQSLLVHQLVDFATALGVEPVSLLPSKDSNTSGDAVPNISKEMKHLLARLNVGMARK